MGLARSPKPTWAQVGRARQGGVPRPLHDRTEERGLLAWTYRNGRNAVSSRVKITVPETTAAAMT